MLCSSNISFPVKSQRKALNPICNFWSNLYSPHHFCHLGLELVITLLLNWCVFLLDSVLLFPLAVAGICPLPLSLARGLVRFLSHCFLFQSVLFHSFHKQGACECWVPESRCNKMYSFPQGAFTSEQRLRDSSNGTGMPMPGAESEQLTSWGLGRPSWGRWCLSWELKLGLVIFLPFPECESCFSPRVISVLPGRFHPRQYPSIIPSGLSSPKSVSSPATLF